MPWRLKRYQQSRQLHYITFTCYHRAPRLEAAAARDLFEHTLERVRRWYGFYVIGYVVMPERVHLLVSEPERSTLAIAIQMLKQVVSRKLRTRAGEAALWQRGVITISMCSANARWWKSCGTCTATRSGAAWQSVRRSGRGAASDTTLRGRNQPWKSNQNGQCANENGWESPRSLPTLRQNRAKGWATRRWRKIIL